MEKDDLRKTLDAIRDHIKSFDSKAQITLGLDGLLAGLLGAEMMKLSEYVKLGMPKLVTTAIVFSSIALLASGLSFVWAIMTVLPRMRLGAHSSALFFGNLERKYGKSIDDAQRDLLAMPDEEVRRHLALEVQANAVICAEKARFSRRALIGACIAITGYMLSLYPYGRLSFAASRSQPPPGAVTCTIATPR